MAGKFIIPFEQISIEDVTEVGGKNASLGEMIGSLAGSGILVPSGYAVTATAYRFFLSETGLESYIKEQIDKFVKGHLEGLAQISKNIINKFLQTPFPKELEEEIKAAHKIYEKRYGTGVSFAVRSSATAEDLPGASFAGEHETYLNIRGVDNILAAIRKAMASLFTARAISYREDKGFDHLKVYLSVGVQKMIRSDLACSGVMFTLDTESGFKDLVLINSSWGLGEMIVQGKVTPDEFLVFKQTSAIIEKKLGVKDEKMIYGEDKPTRIVETSKQEKQTFTLSDKEIKELAGWGMQIEEHYSKVSKKWTPMDTEWAKDGLDGKLYIVQARPETIHAERNFSVIKEYVRLENGQEIVKGASVGNKISTGKAKIIIDPKDISTFGAGEVLITKMTDPDWEPIMKIASAIVTDQGGRTSHAAIVSRELGIPAIVGCKNATSKIKKGEMITVDCTGEEGIVFKGQLKFKVTEHDIRNIRPVKTHIMMNIATPETAFEKSFLPNSGVGLAREEFIIASDIGIHPLSLINYDKLPKAVKEAVDRKTLGYKNKTKFYIDKLSYGIAKIAAAFYPKPVILRFSDFKTNEYRSLLGGYLFEPSEENPMIGWRGASRYYNEAFLPAFKLEVEAVKNVRNEMGLKNLVVMIPFCRTPQEGEKVIKIMEQNGLKRDDGLKVYVMCEIPANVILADKFLDIFDGMSIGSNDLTQLALGIDRDGNEKVKGIANENDESVKQLISEVVKVCKKRGKYIGICGQAPSVYPEITEKLVEWGVTSVSVSPDMIDTTRDIIAAVESKLGIK